MRFKQRTSSMFSSCLLALVGVAASASVAAAQTPARPSGFPDEQCGSPNEFHTFTCEPLVHTYPFTNIYGQTMSSRLDVFLPDAPPDAPGGYPTAMVFHGGGGLNNMYIADGYAPGSAGKNRRGNGARTIKELLLNGYAVLVPHATSSLSNWQTNWPDVLAGMPYSWTSDYRFLNKLIQEIKAPSANTPEFLAVLDANNLFSTGMSDGGAQSSRMARTWPNDFRAVALNAGSWSTCSAQGPFSACNPVNITWNHPPVLFLHAEVDSVVSIEHIDIYARELQEAKDAGNLIPWRAVIARGSNSSYVLNRRSDYVTCGAAESVFCIDYEAAPMDSAGHDWLPEAPDEHVAWFNRYRQ